MRNPTRRSSLAVALVVATVAVSAAHAQRTATNSSTSTPRASALTAADYVEIQQLVSRYAYAVDTHAGNGFFYADLFTPDGVFGGNTKGREALAALAMSTQAQNAGPAYTRHFVTNIIIRPSAEGAVGSQYLVAIEVGTDGKPSTVVHGGRYDDVYVKTPAGWRFKSRILVPSKIGTPPATPGTPATSR